MRLDLAPTPLAPVEVKRKWLMYELLRFAEASGRLSMVKALLQFILAAYIMMTFTLWVGVGLLVFSLLVIDYGFKLLHFAIFGKFYTDMAHVTYGEASDIEQDLRLLLNRAENYLGHRDREDLYKAFEDCYTLVNTKFLLREAIHDLDKREVPKETQSPKP